LLFDVQETEPLGWQVAVIRQNVEQTGQFIVPLVEPVQEPRVPGQAELVALQVVPEQVTVEPSPQVATQVDLGTMRVAASAAGGVAPESAAGAKMAARASTAGSGVAASTGTAQSPRNSSATPRRANRFIFNPPLRGADCTRVLQNWKTVSTEPRHHAGARELPAPADARLCSQFAGMQNFAALQGANL